MHRVSQQCVERSKTRLTGAETCRSARSSALRRNWSAEEQDRNQWEQGNGCPAETKTQWIATLSNSTKRPRFWEQAIISCTRILHIAEGYLNQPSQQLVAPTPAFAEQEKQLARAFAIVREGIAQRAFPGAALAVTHRGSLVASQGFGRFTYEEAAPVVRADTVFDLA